MKKFVVTGGCGFIGSHLSEALLRMGHQVTIIDNLSTGKLENAPAGAKLVISDVFDTRTLQRAFRHADGCFHLAAIASVQKSIEDWQQTHKTNLSATINVLDMAVKCGVAKVVYASSAAVYGNSQTRPISETDPTRPITPYGADKYSCELHAHIASHIHGLDTVGLRFFNVYGPRQDPSSPYSGVISIFADRIRQGKTLTIFGDGQQVRDFIFVRDIVQRLIQSMELKATGSHVMNACTGIASTVNELAQNLMEVSGHNVGIRYEAARHGDIKVSLGNPQRANHTLGVLKTTPLKDGLAETFYAGQAGEMDIRLNAMTLVKEVAWQ